MQYLAQYDPLDDVPLSVRQRLTWTSGRNLSPGHIETIGRGLVGDCSSEDREAHAKSSKMSSVQQAERGMQERLQDERGETELPDSRERCSGEYSRALIRENMATRQNTEEWQNGWDSRSRGEHELRRQPAANLRRDTRELKEAWAPDGERSAIGKRVGADRHGAGPRV